MLFSIIHRPREITLEPTHTSYCPTLANSNTQIGQGMVVMSPPRRIKRDQAMDTQNCKESNYSHCRMHKVLLVLLNARLHSYVIVGVFIQLRVLFHKLFLEMRARNLRRSCQGHSY